MGRQFFIDAQAIKNSSGDLADQSRSLSRIARGVSDVESALNRMTEFVRVRQALDEDVEQMLRAAHTMDILAESARRAAYLYEEEEMEILMHAEHSKMHFQRHETGIAHWNLSGSITIH